jgi:L-ascorbate metabolism protein UlaG (beta-lactamase superfamily)
MSATEAAAFAKAVGTGIVIPHHYNMFEFNTEDPDNFAKAAEKEGIQYQILQIGESIAIE